ncbi:MAG: site-specific integrase [Capsulimonadaceae bacterium]|nr:site-specific integrase [Capsulimonadaceae bacterium]
MERPVTKLAELPLKALAERYLEDFRYDHSLSGFRTYRTWMKRWFQWLSVEYGIDEPTIDDFSPDNIDEYVRYHKHRAPERRNICHPTGDLPSCVSANTVRAAMHPITGLARWLVKKRVLDFDPTETVSIPSRDGSGVRPVSTDANVLRLIEQAEKNPVAKERALDVAILYVLVNSACRVDEVCTLDIADLDLESGCFRSLAKGRKRKTKITYYFTPETAAAIEAWLKHRPIRCQHERLFCHGPRQKITDEYIRAQIRRYAIQAGLGDDKGLLPHGLKHLAGCRLLQQGVDILTVAARLGHTKPTTTLNHYLHVDQLAVRESRFVGLATSQYQRQEAPQAPQEPVSPPTPVSSGAPVARPTASVPRCAKEARAEVRRVKADKVPKSWCGVAGFAATPGAGRGRGSWGRGERNALTALTDSGLLDMAMAGVSMVSTCTNLSDYYKRPFHDRNGVW